MDDIAKKADAKLAEALKRLDARNEAARKEREDREAYRQLWADAQRECLADALNADAVIRLAKAIPANERDGEQAVGRLLAEYGSALDAPIVSINESVGLAVISAKISFAQALLESASAEPNRERIAALVKKSNQSWPYGGGMDLELFHQDLASRRKVDIQAEEDERIRQSIAQLEREVKEYETQQPAPSAVQASADVDKPALALAVMAEIGPNKLQIAKRIGVKRTSMVGPKWEAFNRHYDKLRKA
jgi:hypothetical protein